MKKMILGLLSLAAATACSNSYTVTGTLHDTQADSVYLITTDAEATPLAAAPIADDGAFTLTGKTERPQVAYLTDGAAPLAAIFIEKGKINIAFDEQQGYTASGTQLNDRMTALAEQLNALTAEATPETSEQLYEQYTTAISDAITENIDNLLGVYLFTQQEFRTMEPDKARERLAQFPEALRNEEPLAGVEQMLEALRRTEVGAPMTDLTLPNAEGTPIALSSLTGEGRWVLLDFWATWCAPCRAELPHLKEAYDLYKEKGFTIYAVSIDNDLEAWKAFLPASGMTWPNVAGVNNGRSEAAELYAVSSIPTNFLIGPDGHIVARNLRGDALKEKLAELIK